MSSILDHWNPMLAPPAKPKKQPKKPNYKKFLAKYPAPKIACDEKEFLRTITAHRMTILRDEGVDRHIKFAEPGNSNRWFELITWQGKLCISGDMGTFVFTRLPDMFDFFRVCPNDSKETCKTKLHINPGYWGEKCCAAEREGDRHGMHRWNADTFKNRVADWLVSAEVSQEVLDEAETHVIGTADDGEHYAVQAVIDFECEGFSFQDFWELDCTEWTYHFLWCLYAIAWGIQQYDQHVAAAIKDGKIVVWNKSEQQ